MLNTKNSRFSGKKIIILFLVMTASLFSQNWNDPVQTEIPFSSGSSVDLTTNKDGNHLLVTYASHPTYYLRYSLVNSSGSVVRNYTFENQAVQFASIDGNNDRIYVVYKLGNQIKTRKSTNAGVSWTNDSNILPINIGNNTCNHVDITFGKDDNGLHIVWATQDAGSDYKTYYKRLDPSNAWGTTQTVTDESNVGAFPTVSKSQNRVHVSYTNYIDPAAMTRDKLNTNWQNPQVAFNGQSWRERVHAGASKLFDFYYKLEGGLGQVSAHLYVTERSFTGTSWPAGTLLHSFNGIDHIVSATNTSDGKSHIIYDGYNSVIYRSYSGANWSSEYTVGTGYISPKISSVSNDVFVVWGRDWPVQNQYVQYRQFDAAPLAPSNLAISIVNDESVLSWSPNVEPDVKTGGKYKIYRAETTGGEPSSFELVATINAYNGDTPVTSWTDIESGNSIMRKLFYKISARDYGMNESLVSEYVWRYGRIPKISVGEYESFEYRLLDNFPNPFNPSTKISYSIKENGFVSLKVFDMLGREIADLVNETKDAGEYTIEFNANNLPSGIYIYSIRVNEFVQTGKMTLLK